jgi:hypothetical protein
MFTKSSRGVRRRSIRDVMQLLEALEGRLLFSTYTVTTLGDGAGTITPTGTGTFNASTLRAAMNAANSHSGSDTIRFSSAVVGTISLGTALPAINDALIITGPGSAKLKVSRNAAAATDFAIFRVNAGKTATISSLQIADGTGSGFVNSGTTGGGVINRGTLTLTNCLLTANGGPTFNPTVEQGGAIYSSGNLTVRSCTIQNNTAINGSAIYSTGPLTIRGSTITQNHWVSMFGNGTVFSGGKSTLNSTTISGNDGGGFVNAGNATFSNCTISHNAVTGNGGGILNASGATLNLTTSTVSNNDNDGSGGGLYNAGTAIITLCTFDHNFAWPGNGAAIDNAGTLVLSGSTLSYNQASMHGGGGLENSGAATISNCTFVGNFALWGGAIDNDGPLVLTNCTISGNSADAGIGGIEASPNTTLRNTIVVGNIGNDGSPIAGNILGNVASSSSYNVIGAGGSGGLVNGVNGNKVGVAVSAVKLGALAFNGGVTQTMSLQSGSVAINAGSNTLATNAKLYADQRGLPRISSSKVDVGAFEVQASGGASIAGTFFNDTNRDGKRQTTEPPLAKWQVYIDHNKNGVYDAGEITTFTSSTGTYKFTGLSAGTYRIYEYRQDGWVRTKPAGVYPLGFYDVTLATNQAVSGKDFGNYLA